MWSPDNYDDRAIGPMGLHDAILLDAICRYVRPKVALEYGGLLGHSLSIMAECCGQVISVDDNAHQLLYDAANRFDNVSIVKAKMQEFSPIAITPSAIDFVLFDASHIYEHSVAAFEQVNWVLSDNPILLVHDTGDWYKGELPPQWAEWQEHREIYLQHDRKFVRYLRGQGYSDVTFESSDHLRHGYTVLMKRKW